jgi:hypothetical protein
MHCVNVALTHRGPLLGPNDNLGSLTSQLAWEPQWLFSIYPFNLSLTQARPSRSMFHSPRQPRQPSANALLPV